MEQKDLGNLISQAVAARMTPEFVEAEVNARVDKLITEAVDRALRSYSDTGKLIEKEIKAALHVDRLDLPSYGSTVCAILKAQIEARVSPLVSERLAADMDELLSLVPAEVKLSEIAADMLRTHEDEGYGEVITVIVERNDFGSMWIYLDEGEHYSDHDKYRCDHRLLVGKDGKISCATLGGRDTKDIRYIGRSYGLEQKIRAMVACGSKLIIDEDYVVTSVGDY